MEDRPTEEILVSVTPQVSDAIDRLVKTGLFGVTRAAVVEELVRGRVRDLALEGWIKV